MTLQIKEQDGNILGLEVRDTLKAEDYDKVVPSVEAQIEESGPLCAMLDLRGLERVEPAAWTREVKFDTRHRDDFKRCAVVGDGGWKRMVTHVAAPMFSGEVRFFESDRADEARAWVHG